MKYTIIHYCALFLLAGPSAVTASLSDTLHFLPGLWLLSFSWLHGTRWSTWKSMPWCWPIQAQKSDCLQHMVRLYDGHDISHNMRSPRRDRCSFQQRATHSTLTASMHQLRFQMFEFLHETHLPHLPWNVFEGTGHICRGRSQRWRNWSMW